MLSGASVCQNAIPPISMLSRRHDKACFSRATMIRRRPAWESRRARKRSACRAIIIGLRHLDGADWSAAGSMPAWPWPGAGRSGARHPPEPPRSATTTARVVPAQVPLSRLYGALRASSACDLVSRGLHPLIRRTSPFSGFESRAGNTRGNNQRRIGPISRRSDAPGAMAIFPVVGMLRRRSRGCATLSGRFQVHCRR